MASGSDSGNSSSHSVTRPAPRVKVLCSYGGQFRTCRDIDKFVYYNGIDKFVRLKRDISYADIISRLSNLFRLANADNRVLKYWLPGLNVDVLISVSNDEDLELMMQVYDETFMMRQRFRLFLDPPEILPPSSPLPRQPQYSFQQPQYHWRQRRQFLPRPVATTAPISARVRKARARKANMAPTPSLPHGPTLSAQLDRLEISDDDKNKNVQTSGRDEATSEEHVQDLPLPAATPAPTSAIDSTATPTTPAAAQAEAAEKADAPESI